MGNKVHVYKCKDGRERIYIPGRKGVTSYPKYMMEQHIGRELLPKEEIHHLDGDPSNNDISNLQIVEHGQHQRYHSTFYIDKIVVCNWCGNEFLWSAEKQRAHYGYLKRKDRSSSGYVFCSRKCQGHYAQSIQTEKRAGLAK